jgi:hypothetical protein
LATPAAVSPSYDFKPLDCQTVPRANFGPQELFRALSNLQERL